MKKYNKKIDIILAICAYSLLIFLAYRAYSAETCEEKAKKICQSKQRHADYKNFRKAWKTIEKWECNKNSKGEYIPTYLKTGNEFNICGLSLHAHFDFYINYLKEALNAEIDTNGKIKMVSLYVAIANRYRDIYWKPVKRLPKCLKFLAFDIQVVSGRGVKLLQRGLKLKEDGVVGKKTLSAIDYIGPTFSTVLLNDEYIKHLKSLDHLWPTYKKGWTN